MKKKTTDIVGLATLGVLLVAILLIVLFGDAQDSRLYQQGRQAMTGGDCAAAVEIYSSLISAPRVLDMRGFAYRAAREKDQCDMYQRAVDLEKQGQPGDAAATYYKLMQQYGNSPLFDKAKENLTAIVNFYDVDALASKDFCDNFEGVAGGGGLDYAASTQTFPMIVDACARMYESQGDYASAITWYNDFLEGHMQHDWAVYFREALARVMLAQARKTGTYSLASPVWVGTGTGSTFVLTVYNESPQDVRVVMTGPATQIVRVEGCKNCTPIPATGTNTLDCPRQGRSTRFELPTGVYQVLIESGAGDAKRTYQAAWAMDSGKYETCFLPGN